MVDPDDDALLDACSAPPSAISCGTPICGTAVADTTREGAPSSIAVIGFALSTYPVGVERDWIDRAEAVTRTLTTLRFLMSSDQS